MTAKRGVNFEFKNQVSPRYIEPLLLQIEPNEWTTSAELQQQLRDGGLDVQGKQIIQANVTFWDKIGLGQVRRRTRRGATSEGPGDLTCSAWELWVSKSGICIAPTAPVLRFGTLPVLLSIQAIAPYEPGWPMALCRGLQHALVTCTREDGFYGLGLRPPARRVGESSRSTIRCFPSVLCEPCFLGWASWPHHSFSLWSQVGSLFRTSSTLHTAALSSRGRFGLPRSRTGYGTSLAIDDRQVAAISRTCLLDPGASGIWLRWPIWPSENWKPVKGSGASLVLTGPPRWIDLPDFSSREESVDDEEDQQ